MTKFHEFLLNYSIVVLELMKIYPNFDWSTYSWLKRGPRRRKVLEFVANSGIPVTATKIRKVQKIGISQAAFSLSELCNKKLIKCLNPEDHLGKLFVIENKGRVILKKVG